MTDNRGQNSDVSQELLNILRRYLSEPTSRSVLSSAARRAGLRPGAIERADVPVLMSQLASGLQLFLQDPDKFRACKNALTEVATGSGPVSGETPQTVVVRIKAEEDVVRARAVGRDLSRRLGFTEVAQTKVATAISELARNIVNYAGVGEISVRALAGTRRGVEVVARDEGPGIADPELVMSGNYRSKSGMGAGLRGTRRLVDEFEIETQIGKGTTVRVRKYAE